MLVEQYFATFLTFSIFVITVFFLHVSVKVTVRLVSSSTYCPLLGQVISSGGLAESVAATVEAREGKIRGACLEIAQIVNDWRAHVVGGMETGLLLWEACCVPSLLNGAGTWVNISKATEKKCNQIQYWGLRLFH